MVWSWLSLLAFKTVPAVHGSRFGWVWLSWFPCFCLSPWVNDLREEQKVIGKVLKYNHSKKHTYTFSLWLNSVWQSLHVIFLALMTLGFVICTRLLIVHYNIWIKFGVSHPYRSWSQIITRLLKLSLGSPVTLSNLNNLYLVLSHKLFCLWFFIGNIVWVV